MCGIVGYWGPKNPKDVLLNGLKRLEYRGYDSAGVAIFNNGTVERVRASGKLQALEEKLANLAFNGALGIGHTRWATHGTPSERNAHPHSSGKISLVHNGIIENYYEIREKLLADGVQLQSDTDSELVVHLIQKEMQKLGDLRLAVVEVIPQLVGAYSIVVVSEDHPDTMVAFKDGPPLVVGFDKDQVVVASDIQAMMDHVRDVVYLDDQEVVEIHKGELKFFSAAGFPIEKEITHVEWSADMVEKRGFKHFMLKEIFEQPGSIAAALAPHLDVQDHSVTLEGLCKKGQPLEQQERLDILKDVQRVVFLACGTSFYASMVGEYLIESLARVPVEVDIASEFRYRDPVLAPGTLVVVISQSGETADTLAVLRQARSAGAKVLSLCNVKHSSIDREADYQLYMNAGIEIGVASTKAFTATLAVLNAFALCLGRAKGELSGEKEKELVQALVAVPSQVEAVLAYDKFFSQVADELKKYRGFLYFGRGINFPIALEGALKLKELAYIHAEGYAAGEMKHGPLALIDPRMIVVTIIPSDQHYEKTLSNLEEARARGAVVIGVGSGERKELEEKCEHYLALPNAHWCINPILEVVAVQLLAYHMADAMGHDVDQPRNLAKSVTVE